MFDGWIDCNCCIILYFLIVEQVTEQILESDFKRVALAVKRKRVEEGLEEGVSPDISEPALKRLKMDVPTSMDGSWKHKIQSNHGLVAAISADTGLVLDRHYMTKGKGTFIHFEPKSGIKPPLNGHPTFVATQLYRHPISVNTWPGLFVCYLWLIAQLFTVHSHT